MNDHSLLSFKAITPELLKSFSKSERDKHAECHGQCKHAKESAAVARLLATAFEGCPEIQERIDRQLKQTFEHGQRVGDLENSLRTFAVAMIAQGWELAAFSLEGMSGEGKVM